MTKTSWQFHWRRLFLENYNYALGLFGLWLSIDLLDYVVGINLRLLDVKSVCSAVLYVSMADLAILTKENTTFFLQMGIPRRRSWFMQWLSVLLSTFLLDGMITLYLKIATRGQVPINNFAGIFKSYRAAFNQPWQFGLFLFLMFAFFIMVMLLLGFIFGLLLTQTNWIVALFSVYGGFVTVPGLIAGAIGLVYWQANTTTKQHITAFLYRLIGRSTDGVRAWPLLITLSVVVAILSGVSYLFARRLQAKIRKG
ncbi:hypothetical protein [Lapidilactobacillus bayanensis]|uniref:hypothetical protein n=1 Tax=Lapidilactobacillus bayanensis TaxID=2485998 RepID=UPI000F785B0D|nr:hypothetical protein [Lapidilactobacillus bayanensis]